MGVESSGVSEPELAFKSDAGSFRTLLEMKVLAVFLVSADEEDQEYTTVEL